jgi:hypothetical protein
MGAHTSDTPSSPRLDTRKLGAAAVSVAAAGAAFAAGAAPAQAKSAINCPLNYYSPNQGCYTGWQPSALWDWASAKTEAYAALEAYNAAACVQFIGWDGNHGPYTGYDEKCAVDRSPELDPTVPGELFDDPVAVYMDAYNTFCGNSGGYIGNWRCYGEQWNCKGKCGDANRNSPPWEAMEGEQWWGVHVW